MRYLDPKNDLTFKKVFGEHPHLLKSMLNAMLPFKSESEHIASLEYLPAEQVPQVPLLKNSIVDVRCTDQRGRQIREAIACLEESSYSEEELRGYDKYWDAVSTERSLLIDAEEKGRVEGRSEGLAEGEARGSKQEKSATVVRCRRMGMSISEISAITGLAEAEVLEILEEAGLSKAAG